MMDLFARSLDWMEFLPFCFSKGISARNVMSKLSLKNLRFLVRFPLWKTAKNNDVHKRPLLEAQSEES